MAIFTFEKDAGKRLFTANPAGKHSTHFPLSASDIAALNDAAANAILIYLGTRHFPVTGLAVTYDIASATATIKGLALDQPTREKIVECCGDINGVQHVDDRMMLAVDAEENDAPDSVAAAMHKDVLHAGKPALDNIERA